MSSCLCSWVSFRASLVEVSISRSLVETAFSRSLVETSFRRSLVEVSFSRPLVVCLVCPCVRLLQETSFVGLVRGLF